MKRPTLRSRILGYLRKKYPSWTSKADIERMVVLKSEYTADNAGRTLRLMAEEGVIQVDYMEGSWAMYRASEPTKFYKIEGEDKQIPIWE